MFEYELNSYSRVVSPTFTSLNTESGVGGGLRVSKIITYKSGGEIDKIKRYYYTKTLPNNKNSYSESSGILKNKPVYDSYFATKDQTVMYELGLFGDKPLNAGTAWLGLRQSGGFIAQPTNDDSPVIGYSSIFEESLDAGENRLGYIHYQYSNYDEDIWGNSHLDERFLFATASGDTYADQFSSKSQERGRLMAKDYYDADGKKINSIRYKYQKIYGMANEYLLTVHQQTVFFCSDALLTQFGIFSSAFKTYTYSYLPSECIETTYGMTTGAVEKITSFVYNRHKLQIEKITHGSNDEEYKEKILYSSDIAQNGIQIGIDMVSKHLLNAMVENSQIKNGNVVSANFIKYGQINGDFYKPLILYALNTTPRVSETLLNKQINSDGSPALSAYKIEKEFFYDENGNVLSIKDKDDVFTTYLWGYYDSYPIVEFKNATKEKVDEALQQTDLAFEPYKYIPEAYLESFSELAKYLPQAKISVYVHIPLVGIKTFCDPAGILTYYKYDELGRLSEVKDMYGKVMEKYTYHYVKIKE